MPIFELSSAQVRGARVIYPRDECVDLMGSRVRLVDSSLVGCKNSAISAGERTELNVHGVLVAVRDHTIDPFSDIERAALPLCAHQPRELQSLPRIARPRYGLSMFSPSTPRTRSLGRFFPNALASRTRTTLDDTPARFPRGVQKDLQSTRPTGVLDGHEPIEQRVASLNQRRKIDLFAA